MILVRKSDTIYLPDTLTNELKLNSVLISELYSFIIVRISELVNNFLY
nr:MAG TPA: hypothetical protein [Caudoviricetes sp.]